MSYVYLLDTTLRDGTQGEGVSLTVADKLKIAEKLDDLGVAYIEGGFPGANPKDEEFFRAAKSLHLKHAKLTAFGSTRRPGVRVEDDASVRAVLDASTPVVAIVGKAWDFHVTEALRIDLDENLAMIRDTVQYLKQHGREVIFDAEHFFDGFKRNRAYALATVRAAWEAGVDWVALCDTNGGSMPHEIHEMVTQVIQEVPVQVGIHTHNDCELAVANSLAAVQAGARMVHGTINGIGERCGNANLASIIPNLELKLGYPCLPSRDHLRLLTPVARFVGEVCNLVAHSYQPFVGHSAFAHKGGIHVSAIQRDPETYEHIPPELVGNERRVLLSELSGVSNVLAQAQAFGIPTEGRETELRRLLERIKQMEHMGYQFEGAEASQELLFRRVLNDFTPPFKVLAVRVDTDVQRQGEATSQAIIKLEVDGEIVHTVSEGNGPVNALDAVLRKALAPHRPEIRRMHLTDYKVRVLDEKDATAARVRVLIESTDGEHVWRTVGVSENVIAASWEALVDSIQYYLALVVPSQALVEA